MSFERHFGRVQGDENRLGELVFRHSRPVNEMNQETGEATGRIAYYDLALLSPLEKMVLQVRVGGKSKDDTLEEADKLIATAKASVDKLNFGDKVRLVGLEGFPTVQGARGNREVVWILSAKDVQKVGGGGVVPNVKQEQQSQPDQPQEGGKK